MVVSQLIEILSQEMDKYGDNEVLLVRGRFGFNVTYLGTVDLDNGKDDLYFFLTAESKIQMDDWVSPYFKAPKNPVRLKLVK